MTVKIRESIAHTYDIFFLIICLHIVQSQSEYTLMRAFVYDNYIILMCNYREAITILLINFNIVLPDGTDKRNL
jgi:hypothetical protein